MSTDKKNLKEGDKNFNSVTKSKEPKTLTYGGENSHWQGGAQNNHTETIRDEARKNKKIIHQSKID
jgi:hypothetical protein